MKEGKLFIQLGKHILGLYSVTCKQLHLIQPMYPAVFLVLPRGQFGSWSFPKYLDGDLLMHYAPNKIFFFFKTAAKTSPTWRRLKITLSQTHGGRGIL